MKWIETTLRKGAKSPKICRDMFVADSRGIFSLYVVKNGKEVLRKILTDKEASEIIMENRLVSIESNIFKNCCTYRTQKSNELIRSLY